MSHFDSAANIKNAFAIGGWVAGDHIADVEDLGFWKVHAKIDTSQVKAVKREILEGELALPDARVQRGIGTAIDDHAVVSGQLREVAMAPDVVKAFEIRSASACSPNQRARLPSRCAPDA